MQAWLQSAQVPRCRIVTTILAILVLLVLAWLAVKVIGFAIKATFVLLIAGTLYWLLAPMLGLPLP